ncbi:hypothetical protein OHB13_37810 (plasmid) [Streptomyces sp. NBC_00440]|uniref:hypothetical protein n=1 Tax=unclassified Streptomyces TaxID=2593676 RepID=UPI002E2093DC|nr:hypothetical protein OG760_37165 [Streptomyces sp. NBC_00963]
MNPVSVSSSLSSEQFVLDAARATGIRAAAWLRALAVEKGNWPEWMRGQPNPLLDLADAVEQALSRLDPYDSDERDPATGEFTDGYGGVPPELRDQLEVGVVGALFDGAFGGNQPTPAQTAAVITVASAVRMAADLHGWGDYTTDLPVLCAAIDHAVAVATAGTQGVKGGGPQADRRETAVAAWPRCE